MSHNGCAGSATALGNGLIGLARQVARDRRMLLKRMGKNRAKDIDWTLRMRVWDALDNAMDPYFSLATRNDLCAAVWDAAVHDFNKDGHE